MSNAFMTLAELLSAEDPSILPDLTACAADPARYFEEHQGAPGPFQHLGGTATEADCPSIQWVVLLDLLVSRGLAAELDWKCEREDFVDAVGALAGVRSGKLPLAPGWFDPDAALDAWCETLDARWNGLHRRMVYLYIYSDSRVLLPLPADTVDALAPCVRQEGPLPQVCPPGMEDPFRELGGFFQRHPFVYEEPGGDERADQCALCAAHREWVGGDLPCARYESRRFQVAVPPQALTARQTLAVADALHMGALPVRRQLAAGEPVRGEDRLVRTLQVMNALDAHGVACTVTPYPLRYPQFPTCLRRWQDD